MPTLRNVGYILIVLAVVLVSLVVRAEPLPRTGYRWRLARTDIPGWNWEGAPPQTGTWIAVPKALGLTDTKFMKPDAGTVRLKTQPELDADAASAAANLQTSQRVSRLSEFVAARDSLAGLQAARSEMNGTKILTRIDARIAAAQTVRDVAFAALRDL